MRRAERASRRAFLTAGGAALAAAGCGGRTGGPAAEAATPTAPAGWATALRAGQRLMGVELTEAEIAQAARGFADQLALVERRRALPQFPRSLSPATTYDPRPRGGAAGADEVALARPRAGRTPTDADLAFASIAELGAWLSGGKVTARALTELALSRLATIGRRLECVITPTPDRARAEAAEADARIKRGRGGPLDGIPYGLKDMFDTSGVATTFGAEPFRARVPTTDAVVATRLRAAGAVLCAKLSLGALAYGDRWFGGRTRNPWNVAEGSSGSSAGPAAAVAAGLVPFALGSETLGSIVAPATRCGVVGLRPSFGRVPRSGAMPLCWSLDKVGPLTRTVEDAVAVLAAIHGADPGDPSSVSRPLRYAARRDLRGVRIGHLPGLGLEGVRTRQLDKDALAALRGLGAEVVEVEPVTLPVEGLLPILLAESAACFEPLTLEGRDDQLAWQDDEAWPNTFRLARFLSAVDLIQADRLRRMVADQLGAAMEKLDAVVAPSSSPLLTATNFTGHPSLTLRTGFAARRTRPGFGDDEAASGIEHRVPHGLTLYGRLDEDGALCAIGDCLERALAVWRERPPLG